MGDLYRYAMLVLHSGVVWLHGIELAHQEAVTITASIGAAFMAISLVEVIHLSKRKKKNEKDTIQISQ